MQSTTVTKTIDVLRQMGKIFKKANEWFVPKLRLFPVYTVHEVGHFVTSVRHAQRATCILERDGGTRLSLRLF